ncbi:MAG TPA: HNH endonuclease [Solirubrobacterales bacterium]
MKRGPRFTREEFEAAIAASLSWSETLRRLGYRSAGGNAETVKRYARRWGIDWTHFRRSGRGPANRGKAIPLARVLVRGSTYSRKHLKERLFREGLKERRCEECGQGELWRGKRMALIIDHINGVPNDNRLENLRILCPNCAATLDTHCGRKNRRLPRACEECGAEYRPRRADQRFCSRACGERHARAASVAVRKVERPPYERLCREVEELGYSAVGRRYGVSDNAVRKWLRYYERERVLRLPP